jgi:hypothetical protein
LWPDRPFFILAKSAQNQYFDPQALLQGFHHLFRIIAFDDHHQLAVGNCHLFQVPFFELSGPREQRIHRAGGVWRHGNGPRGEHRLVWRCSSTGTASGHNAWFQTELRAKVIEYLRRSFPQYLQGQRTARAEPKEDAQAAGLLAELHRRLERLEEAYLAGQWDPTRYTTRKEQLDREIAEAEETVRQAANRVELHRTWIRELNAMTQVHDIPLWFDQTNPVEINKTLHIFLQSIIVRKNIELVFK